MQFLLIAHDGTDEHALTRRMAARPAHVARGDKMRDEGSLLFATAILNESGVMVGSMMVFDVESREVLDAWLACEPYVTGGVWERIEVRPCKVGPSFSKQ